MDYFKCPLSGKTFENPVIAEDGFTYEESAIKKWFEEGNIISPVTCENISKDVLIPNNILKTMNPQEVYQREQSLEEAGLRKDSEQIAMLHKDLHPQKCYELLKEFNKTIDNTKNGKIPLEAGLATLKELAFKLKDPETLETFALISLWCKKIEDVRESAKMLEEYKGKDYICAFLESSCLGILGKKEEGLILFDKTCQGKEENLFLVREIKFKGIAMSLLGKLEGALNHMEAYEGLKPYQTFVFGCFRGQAMQKLNRHMNAIKYLGEHLVLYGKNIFMAELIMTSLKAQGFEKKEKEFHDYLSSLSAYKKTS